MMDDPFTFGPFRFYQTRGILLLRNTEEIHLGPREAKVLECLLEHRGRRVSYEELANAVWGENKKWPDDFLGALQNMVWRIKEILRKHASDEITRLIQSKPKFGYWFTLQGANQWL